MKKLILNFDSIEKKNIGEQVYFTDNYNDILKNNNKKYIYPTFCENKKDKLEHLKKLNNLKKIVFYEIIQILNDHFKCKFDNKFWRILIGPWFDFSIETFYNRLNSIRKILETHNISNATLEYEGDLHNLSSKNTLEFIYNIDDLVWNRKVYIFILGYLNIEINKKCIEKKKLKKKQKLNFNLNNIIHNILTNLVEFGDKLVVNTSLPSLKELKLQILIKQIPLRIFYDKLSNIKFKNKFDKNLRNNLYKKYIQKNLNTNKDNDEDFYVNLLLKSIPIIFLENFNLFRSKISKKKFVKKLKIIITSQNFDTNEYFKFVTAFSYLNGCKIYYLQHGNVDGVLKFDIYDNHIITPDKFYTWGWTKPNSNNIKKQKILPFYNLKSSGNKVFDKNFDFQNKIIFFGTHYYRRRHFWDVFNINRSLYNNQFIFLGNLIPKLQNITSIKLGDKFLKETKDKIYKINNNIKNFESKKPIFKYNNLLSVFSYDSTGFYEHLCLNKPVIIYYDFSSDDINENAKIYYDKLKSVNIIHSNPIQAAKFISNNYDNLLNWWYSNETQFIINEFNKNYNKYTKNPLKNIMQEFKL